MISSRTPEGSPNHCPICGKHIIIEPSIFPRRDAPCPRCGTLLEFDEPEMLPLGTHDMEPLFDLIDKWALRGEANVLRVDFGDVDDIGSSLLGRLLTLHMKAQKSQSRLVLYNVRPMVLKALQLAKLDRVLTIE